MNSQFINLSIGKFGILLFGILVLGIVGFSDVFAIEWSIEDTTISGGIYGVSNIHALDENTVYSTNPLMQKTNSQWMPFSSSSTEYSVIFGMDENTVFGGGFDTETTVFPIIDKITSQNTERVLLDTENVGSIVAIDFFDSLNGLALNELGVVYRTTDGGNTWTYIVTIGTDSYTPTGFDIEFIDINSALAISVNSLYTIDLQTNNVVNRHGVGMSAFTGLAVADSQTAFAISDVIYESRHGWQNWQESSIQMNPGTVLLDIDFENPSVGMIVGEEIFLTTNGGIHWKNIPSDGNMRSGASSVSFASTSVVYVLADDVTSNDVRIFKGIVPIDTDADGIVDDVDNCPLINNYYQTDTDRNGIGDVCDENIRLGCGEGTIQQGTECVAIPLDSTSDGSSSADNVPPLIITPSDITQTTTNPDGEIIEFSVKAIDDVDGVIPANCTPESGSLFVLGDTKVTCYAKDSSNPTVSKSFNVNVVLDDSEGNPDFFSDGTVIPDDETENFGLVITEIDVNANSVEITNISDISITAKGWKLISLANSYGLPEITWASGETLVLDYPVSQLKQYVKLCTDTCSLSYNASDEGVVANLVDQVEIYAADNGIQELSSNQYGIFDNDKVENWCINSSGSLGLENTETCGSSVRFDGSDYVPYVPSMMVFTAYPTDNPTLPVIFDCTNDGIPQYLAFDEIWGYGNDPVTLTLNSNHGLIKISGTMDKDTKVISVEDVSDLATINIDVTHVVTDDGESFVGTMKISETTLECDTYSHDISGDFEYETQLDPLILSNFDGPDADEDGLTDSYEAFLKTDFNNRDTDGDGVNDGREIYAYHTNPLSNDVGRLLDLGLLDGDDADGDGIPTSLENDEYGTDPDLRDTDGDRYSDYEELFIHGTDANDPESIPSFPTMRIFSAYPTDNPNTPVIFDCIIGDQSLHLEFDTLQGYGVDDQVALGLHSNLGLLEFTGTMDKDAGTVAVEANSEIAKINIDVTHDDVSFTGTMTISETDLQCNTLSYDISGDIIEDNVKIEDISILNSPMFEIKSEQEQPDLGPTSEPEETVLVESWVKDVAGWWANEEINDDGFIDAAEYLIANDVMQVEFTESTGDGSGQIDDWIKQNAKWWSDGQPQVDTNGEPILDENGNQVIVYLTDEEFIAGIEWLIGEGIIQKPAADIPAVEERTRTKAAASVLSPERKTIPEEGAEFTFGGTLESAQTQIDIMTSVGNISTNELSIYTQGSKSTGNSLSQINSGKVCGLSLCSEELSIEKRIELYKKAIGLK